LAQYQFFKLQGGIPLPLHLKGKEYIEREFFACYLLVAGRKGLNLKRIRLNFTRFSIDIKDIGKIVKISTRLN
jgi:hypothetical protein